MKLKWLAWAAAVAAVGFLLPPQDGAARSRKEIFKATMPAVVLVISANIENGTLHPKASGSGTIIDQDGSVLTNHHVIFDAKNDRLFDVFLIGRFHSADREPLIACAGSPERSKLKADLDLALIKCDMDMNGRPRQPSSWPSLPIGRSENVVPGEQVWVLGYPNVGGSTIHVTAGLVSGWTGERGGAGSRAFMKTDAAITHGNSGGTAIDETGAFIGVPTAFRWRKSESEGEAVSVDKVGLIRPVEHARDLIAVARTDWVPSKGQNMAASERDTGVVVTGKIIDSANGRGVAGALVVVFKPEVGRGSILFSEIENQALSWAQTNAAGEFTLLKAIPRGGDHFVGVVAMGYRSRVLKEALTIPADAPDLYKPWAPIEIQRQ